MVLSQRRLNGKEITMSMHALVLNRYHGPLELTELSRPRPSQGGSRPAV
jgi:hypothetical protein